MLIASSEEALKAHNIDNGWDKTKVPGATTMNLTLWQIRLNKARNFLVHSRMSAELPIKDQSLYPAEYMGWIPEKYSYRKIKLHCLSSFSTTF